MPTATLTAKGQVTIPMAVRTALGLHAGSRLDFELTTGGFRVVPATNAATALKGRFAGRVAAPATLEAIDEAIAQESLARSGRSGSRFTDRSSRG